MRHWLFLALLLFFYCVDGTCQSKIDSLQRQLSVVTSDTTRIELYHQIAELYSDLQPEQALTYELKALEIADKENNNKKKAEVHTKIGIIYRKHSNYRDAINHYKKTLQLVSTGNFTETLLELGIAYLRIMELDSAKMYLDQGFAMNKKFGDKRMEAQLYNMSGNVSKDANDYKNALAYYIQSANGFEKLDDNDGLTQSISNIGNMHYLMGNYKEAEVYALRSLSIAENISKKMSIAYSNRLLGRIYRQQQRFDEALTAYAKAINIYQEMDAKRDIGETHYNRGNIYFEKEDFKGAIREYFSAIGVERQIQDTFNMAHAYSAIGEAYHALDDPKRAKVYMDTAMLLANLKKIPTLEAYLYDVLSSTYANENNYKLAYDYHLKFTQLNDSLEEAQQQEEAAELAARYKSEKKEDEIRALNAENEITALQLRERNNERIYLVIFIILAVAMIGVIYNRYKTKARTTEKLKELDEMKSRFFANLSHEFRTPLSLIVIPLQNKLASENMPEHKISLEKKDVEMMYRNASRLQMLINQLLDLSKIESGKMQLQIRQDNLSRVVRLVHASFESAAEQKGIEFKLLMEESEIIGFFDQDKIEKILYNLLSNAFKFTDKGKQVSLIVSRRQEQVSVIVRDTGIGISAENLNRIFDRFYQGDDSIRRSQEGTGIGLALANELAELHCGKLTASSTPGAGSEFEFSFSLNASAYKAHTVATMPLVEDANSQLQYPVSSGGEVIAEELSGNKPIALVAEDHPDMRRLIQELLEKSYEVIVATNGDEAWEKAVESVPDIIVCDIMMPGMDGISLSGKLKNHDATSHIPVIMLTARGDRETKLEGLKTGADDYLTKPFDPDELMVRVTNLVMQRKKLQEIYRQEIILQPKNIPLSQPENIFIQKVATVVEANFEDPEFGLDEFCRQIGMSRMQLHRKLKALTDKSPGEFLREFRMERACQLLMIKGSPVSEVAYKVGYNNLSHFAKTFKEHTGHTPSGYFHAHEHSLPK